MAAITLEPFRDALLGEAAALLAARFREERLHEPLLPTRFAEVDGALAAVTAAWREPGACGVAALRGGQLLGYLLMAPRIDATWGRSAWARPAGHAVAREADADLYRDLYVALAPEWVERGCLVHYVMAPATDRAALDAWFALSFGQQQAYALVGLPVTDRELPALDPAVTLRRAGPNDLERLLDVADLVAGHQARSPVYGAFLPEARDDRRESYAELLSDPHAALWIVVEAERVLSFALFLPEEPSDSALYTPDGCVDLALAATREEQRRRSLGRALAGRGLAAAADEGAIVCAADWRTTNLQASRFWPRFGFRPVVYRLERRIDERALWAK